MRLALGVEYDGTDFCGWQRQLQGPTVQGAIEEALSFVANHKVEVVCAGRTDAGVHATGQVIHFDTDSERNERAWILGVNSRLPDSVCLRWVQPVAEDFHARFGAVKRSYRYSICNRSVRTALFSRLLTWERVALDVAAMQQASASLVGTHDFTSFRTVACQANSPVRTIHSIEFSQEGQIIHMDICANAFLHHMVRNIIGSLLEIGRGDKPKTWIAEILAAKSRKLAAPTAASTGLVFVGPKYPAKFELPKDFCE